MTTGTRRSGGRAALALCLCTAAALAARAAPQAPTFSSHSDLVVLHVAVTDRRGAYVAGLSRDRFHVAENGVDQAIALFSADEAPATIGLLIDDSASMHGLRELVTAAAGEFVATSNPADEIFALAFNEVVHPVMPPDQPFTSDAGVLRGFLFRAIRTHGRTALYDAVGSGVRYLGDGAHPRKALVILSDGGDNASVATREIVEQAAAAANTAIYAVIMDDPADTDARPKLLQQLAETSGGVVVEVQAPGDLPGAFTRIARDIRSRYTVAYEAPAGPPGVRHVRVTVDNLRARTRAEYLAK